MKHCPECDSSYPDTDKFCELDGTPLVADPSDIDPNLLVPSPDRVPEPDVPPEVVGASGYQDSGEPPRSQNWKTLAIVAVAGVAIGVILFIVYHRITREAPEQGSNDSANVAVTQEQVPPVTSAPSPFASASPSPEPSPSPSARPTPAVQAEPARVALSSSPVSTSGSETTTRPPVTIRLTDGTSVEADEAWETKEGIWYRRRGLMTLLKRDQVKAIEQPSTPSPAATSTASPSPSP